MTTPEFLLSAWDWKPSVAIGCAALVAVYVWAAGFRSLRKIGAWLLGVLLIFLTLVSPFNVLGDDYLFSVHMAKHILFVLVIPALLLIGLPTAPVERVLRYRPAAAAERLLRRAMPAWIAGIGAMALWHIPAFFSAAMASQPLHILEHISLLVCGTIFWWPILSPLSRARLNPVPQGTAYLFTACLACSAMGVLITFAPRLLYPAYAHPVDAYAILPVIRERWGILPETDQQIGGLLMWVPGCLVYLTAIMAMFARWYGEDAERGIDGRAAEAQWT